MACFYNIIKLGLIWGEHVNKSLNTKCNIILLIYVNNICWYSIFSELHLGKIWDESSISEKNVLFFQTNLKHHLGCNLYMRYHFRIRDIGMLMNLSQVFWWKAKSTSKRNEFNFCTNSPNLQVRVHLTLLYADDYLRVSVGVIFWSYNEKHACNALLDALFA